MIMTPLVPASKSPFRVTDSTLVSHFGQLVTSLHNAYTASAVAVLSTLCSYSNFVMRTYYMRAYYFGKKLSRQGKTQRRTSRSLGAPSMWDRPFQARLTRCAATSSLPGLRSSSHHWPV